MANQWLRLWHDLPNDPKWRTIARVSKQSIGNVVAVYVHLLVNASNASERGRTQNVSSEDIASALDVDTEQVDAILSAMQGRVLDGDRISGWNRRQPEREDGAAERAKAWREAKKAEKEALSNAGQTHANASERKQTPDKEKSREEQKEPPKPPAGGLTVVPPPEGKVKTRGIALKTFLADCEAQGLRPMRDYEPLWKYTESAKLPREFVVLAWAEFVRRFGAGGVKEANLQKDWRKTFRNYVENNYLRLWSISADGEYYLTPQGKQAQTVAEAA